MIRPETYSIVLPLALQSGLGIRRSSRLQGNVAAHLHLPFRFPALAKADRLYELNSEEKCERRSTRCCRDLSISKEPALQNSNKNQEPKTEPLSTFGFGLLVFYLTIF